MTTPTLLRIIYPTQVAICIDDMKRSTKIVTLWRCKIGEEGGGLRRIQSYASNAVLTILMTNIFN